MNHHSIPFVLTFGLVGCAHIDYARVVPTRIDLVGRIMEVAYQTKGYGMERAFAAHIESGGRQQTVYGYGSDQYEILRKAMRNRSLVAFQCEEERQYFAGPPCKVAAVEEVR